MGNNTKRISIIFGVFMVAVLALSTLIPLFNPASRVAQQPQVEPTTVPTATFPPPITDLESLALDQVYLHPSGMFTIGDPAGWMPSEPVTEFNRVGATLINNNALSVIEVSVEEPVPAISTLDELDARFTTAYLQTSWERYSRWTESSRRKEDDRLLIDFELTLNRQLYVARQASWLKDGWIYSVRVVAPSNATDMLVYLIDHLGESIHTFSQFKGTPFNWNAYYDPERSDIIRYPRDWVLADSAPGRPTSITAPDGTTLRIQAEAGAKVATEEDARAWLESNQSSAQFLSAVPVQRGDAQGFAVAYTEKTVDGEPLSGLAVLLNGADALHVANLRFPEANVDLNNFAAPAEATAEATPELGATPVPVSVALAEVMQTYTLLPKLNLATEGQPTPAPTAVPQIVTTVIPVEVTAAATEASAEVTPEATASATESE